MYWSLAANRISLSQLLYLLNK